MEMMKNQTSQWIFHPRKVISGCGYPTLTDSTGREEQVNQDF